MVLDNVANVPDHWVFIVTPFQILKETEIEEMGALSEEEKGLRCSSRRRIT